MHPPDPEEAPHQIPITGELDLHTFRPSELGDLLPEYFLECQKLGILNVRVIHGKGTGTLRSGVHHLLERLTDTVEAWHHPAAPTSGSWGATQVRLRAAKNGIAPTETK